jgi:HSP20 family protein
MKLMPWRERSAPLSLHGDLDEWFDRLFEEPALTRLPEVFRRTPLPAVNLGEDDKELTATFELPGLTEDDIEIQILGNQLVVSGERKWEDEKKGKEYHRVESQYGAFRRSILLPDGLDLDPDAIQATYEKGLLQVTLPKLEPKPATRIQVKKGK